MIRGYVDTSQFRAPYGAPGLMMGGLGQAPAPHSPWPGGRRMYDISNFMAPYDEFAFQDNQLMGLGAEHLQPEQAAQLPDAVRRYLITGEPVGTIRRDLSAASAQVPRWTWALLLAGAGYMTYRSYQAFKKAKQAKPARPAGEYTPAARQLTSNPWRRIRRHPSAQR